MSTVAVTDKSYSGQHRRDYTLFKVKQELTDAGWFIKVVSLQAIGIQLSGLCEFGKLSLAGGSHRISDVSLEAIEISIKYTRLTLIVKQDQSVREGFEPRSNWCLVLVSYVTHIGGLFHTARDCPGCLK